MATDATPAPPAAVLGFYLDGPGAFPREPWEGAIPMIADHGFRSVDISAHRGVADATTTTGFSTADRGRLRRLLDRAGLRVGAVVTHVGLADRTRAPGDGNLALDLPAVVDLATDVGAEAVTVHIGGGGDGQAARRRELCVLALQAACDRGKSAGVEVLIDALVPDSLVADPEEFVDLANDVGRSNFGWNADPAFLYAVRADLAACLERLRPWTRHAHLKDVTGRWPEVRWRVPGDGDLDWRDVRDMLGPVHASVEVIARPNHADTTLEVALERSSDVLRQCGWPI